MILKSFIPSKCSDQKSVKDSNCNNVLPNYQNIGYKRCFSCKLELFRYLHRELVAGGWSFIPSF